MKRMRNVTTFVLAFLMMFNFLGGASTVYAAGGNRAYSATNTQKVSAPPFELPDTDGAVLDIYTFNQELESNLEAFFAVYPQYKDMIKFHLYPSDPEEEYINSIEAAVKGTENIPDLIVWNSDPTRYAVEQSYVANLSDIGFDASWYKNAYPYTIANGSKGENLRAVTWQSKPGCFLYRTDIAQEVFGTSDPEEVQKLVSDWDTFLATAETLKKKGYKILAGMDAMNLAHFYGNEVPWITGNTVNMNSCATRYLGFEYSLYQNEYTNNHDMWSDEWRTDFDGNVFGFQAVDWFINYCMEASVHENDYKVCEGPGFFSWGETYITATTKCDNKDLAKLLLYTITCDTSYMKQVSIDSREFANNAVVNEEVYKEGKAEQGKLQNNPYPVWMNVAKNIAPVQNSYDVVTLNKLTDEVRTELCSESSSYGTVQEAIQELEKRIKEKFPNRKVIYGASAHHYSTEWTIDKAATCSTPGSKSHHCTDEDCIWMKDVTEIPATGEHTYDAGTITVLPTCVTKGQKVYTCSSCKCTKTEEIPATGNHTYGEWQETVAATCNTTGIQERHCTVCGAVETQEIPATGFVKGGEFSKNGSTYVIKTVKGKKGTVVYEGSDKNKKKVKIPKTVKIDGKTYTVTEISAEALKGDITVKSVVVPDTITKIGKGAFSGCKNLKSVTIQSTKLKSVGAGTFKGIYKKATIKVPKKQYDKYKKLLNSKTGYKKSMKIKK